ncbi:GroES-like protein [Trametes coccinea BRFM310]|uniref:GroES-like protein n=1 Tax=Trametes coccinea (strain BRFM310) TaxID=1353009 RepID=A0A1Y2IT29_TRAC3|nr:GroES-like protein [Trametes coccinea BRFM310]
MSIPTKQLALVLEEERGPLVIKHIDVPKPGPEEILVRIEAAGLNPGDWKVVRLGKLIDKYPVILGFDAAGVAVEVGSNVKDYAVGDRVLFQGWFDFATREAHGHYKQYSIAIPEVRAKFPASLSFEEAATIPSGLAAAALPLYSRVELAPSAKLIPPWEEGGRGYYAGKPFFVLGGASSIGQYVIQLARLSGFSPIITTASLHNTDLLKSLGATHVLDRKLPSETLVKEACEIAGGPLEVVFDAVSLPDTLVIGYQATAPTGTFVKVNSESIPGVENPEKKVHFGRGLFNAPFNAAVSLSLLAKLPELLENGDIKPNRVEVIPGGLRGVDPGLDRLQNNEVSAVKLVVKPQETTV